MISGEAFRCYNCMYNEHESCQEYFNAEDIEEDYCDTEICLKAGKEKCVENKYQIGLVYIRFYWFKYFYCSFRIASNTQNLLLS